MGAAPTDTLDPVGTYAAPSHGWTCFHSIHPTMIRTFDEAHLYRLLKAKLDEVGGTYAHVDKALGMKLGSAYAVLVTGNRICERVANALGFRKEVPGNTRIRPMKFVRVQPSDINGCTE